KRTVCSANLRGIGQGMQIYAQDDDEFPPNLQALINNLNSTPKQFVCPQSNTPVGHVNACYIYIPGQTGHSNRRNGMIYEKRGNHSDDLANVLFVDGHVESIRPYLTVLKLVSETRARMAEADDGKGAGSEPNRP